jgi:hypothetical protein
MAEEETTKLLREIRDILAANQVEREKSFAAHEEEGKRLRAEFLDLKRQE